MLSNNLSFAYLYKAVHMRYVFAFIIGFIAALFLKSEVLSGNLTQYDNHEYGLSLKTMSADKCKELVDEINQAQQEYSKIHPDQIPKNLHLYYCY